jgi:hypothetical protein
MGKEHQNQKKTVQTKLATRKISSINRKQTPSVQSSTETHVFLWNAEWGQPPIPMSKYSSAFNPRISDPL